MTGAANTRRRFGASVGLALLALALAGGPAGAATQVGETFPPSTGCDAPRTQLQTTAPGSIYVVPSAGVITSWSFMAAADTQPRLKLKVARPAGGDAFEIVGESAVETPVAGVLNTYLTRISVRAGDVLGFHNVTLGRCGNLGPSPPYGSHSTTGGVEAPAGATTTFNSGGMFHLDVAAMVEPDADNDGYGDETQDCAPADAARNADCAPPQTTISAGPKDKTKTKSATFEFTGIDARAVAGFECSLDGGPFTACGSPHTVKVKKGKHTFSVRAVDQVGNVDDVPATDTWKVKKKRKKKK